jgi:hypothetical protein
VKVKIQTDPVKKAMQIKRLVDTKWLLQAILQARVTSINPAGGIYPRSIAFDRLSERRPNR